MTIFDLFSSQQWTAVFTISAVSSVISATVSWSISMFAIRRSRKVLEAQIALASWEEYGSPQMLSDLILLQKFQEKYPRDFSKKLVEGRKTNPAIIKVDHARRRVKTHFLKAVWLHRNKLISDELFTCMIDSRGIQLLQEIVRPMTIATDSLDNPEIADFEYLVAHREMLRWGKKS